MARYGAKITLGKGGVESSNLSGGTSVWQIVRSARQTRGKRERAALRVWIVRYEACRWWFSWGQRQDGRHRQTPVKYVLLPSRETSMSTSVYPWLSSCSHFCRMAGQLS